MTDSSLQLIREDVPTCKAIFTPEISRPVSGKVVRLAGVEPATLGLEVRCSSPAELQARQALRVHQPELADPGRTATEGGSRSGKECPENGNALPSGSVGDGRFPRWACVAFCLPPRRAEVTHEARDRRPHRRSCMRLSRPCRAW